MTDVDRMAEMQARLSKLESYFDSISKQFAQLAIKVSQLDMQSLTGARHVLCYACNQIMPVTLTGHFMPHQQVGTAEKCYNSGGEANG